MEEQKAVPVRNHEPNSFSLRAWGKDRRQVKPASLTLLRTSSETPFLDNKESKLSEASPGDPI